MLFGISDRLRILLVVNRISKGIINKANNNYNKSIKNLSNAFY